jgi:AmiR/NasT family two-component response regulator
MPAPTALKILIAEHDPQTTVDLCAQLANLGHEVFCEAQSCAQTIQLARSHQPDLVIVDIAVPEADGIQVCSQIAEQCSCPMILLGASSDHDFVQQVSRLPIQGYLVKPVREQELGPAIELAIARYADTQQLQGQLEQVTEVLDILTAIKRATARLVSELHCTPQEAWDWLQQEARAKRAQMHQVARAILKGENPSYYYDVPI